MIEKKAKYSCLKIVFIFGIFILNTIPGYAQLTINEIFSDHMVLQRNHPVNLWGKADAGNNVKIDFNATILESISDASGNWHVTFPAMEAGGPFSITISSAGESMVLADVYVGDVWLCSGQSNMEWTVENSLGFEEAVAEAVDTKIRHIKVPHDYAESPEDQIPPCDWVVNSPESVSDFTAVGYYFAKALREHHDVPIGLLNSSWGGSRIEAWMSAESLGAEEASKAINEMKLRAEEAFRERQKILSEKFPGLGVEDMGMKGDYPLWADVQLDDSKWIPLSLPQMWEEQGLEGFDGVGWYRISVDLRKEDLGRDFVLKLSKIDDSDQVWVNGNFIGGITQAWDKIREYTVMKNFMHEGENIITVRVEDTGGGGGIYGEAEDVYLQTSSRKISLSGTHMFKAGSILSFTPATNAHHTPTLLYNKMIHPILEFPIKGVIWYQGESNAGNEEEAYQYRYLFQNLITDWRAKWKQHDLPFMYVQLANFMEPDDMPVDSYWALLRESQHASLKIKNVGEAVIIDLGEANDIHPRNKYDVGFRLSLPARKWAYGEDLIHSGPIPVKQELKGQKVIITFNQNLKADNKYGYARGFAIAGEDKKFTWAKGIIHNNKVEVWTNEIVNPKYIRYGWANNPDDINIYNDQMLPASPFRMQIK